MSELVGRVIEFLDNGIPKLAVVTGEAKNRLQVTDQNGRQHSIKMRQISAVYEAQSARQEFPALAANLEREINRFEKEVDTQLLWEALASEGANLKLEQLAQQYFGSSEGHLQSAIFRALQADKLHFKLRGTQISVKTRQQVEEQLFSQARRQAKLEERRRSLEWAVRTLTIEGLQEPDPETENLLRQTEEFLMGRENPQVASWLEDVSAELVRGPLALRELACELLIKAQRLPEDSNPFLLEAGIDPRFPEPVLAESAALTAYHPDLDRTSVSGPVFSIDDEDTREIDDAVSAEETEAGLRIGIHIADVAAFVQTGSALDSEAHKRSSSIYLPQTTVRMFPDRISCDLASLETDQLRPSLSCFATVASDGQIADYTFARTELTVTHKLTYDQADRELAGPADSVVSEKLQRIHGLTRFLREARLARGAVQIPRPELKITVTGEEIGIKVLDPSSPSRQLISELMILVNHLAALYACDQSLPLIFRTQSGPGEPLQTMETYDAVLADQLFSKLEPSKASLTPNGHFALGLKAYTQVTSPLRRISDLTLQRQLIAQLEKKELPYLPQDLMEILGSVQTMESRIRALERRAARLLTLRYLKERAPSSVEVVVIREIPGGHLVETTDLFVRGRLVTTKEILPGDRLNVTIRQIHPEDNLFILSH
jgi:exoribonuclease-2